MYAVVERASVENFQSNISPNDSFTMGQQHRPVFRKRSLAELPGNVRVPVFKKPDRLKSRLEASLAGLRELQSLREKHQMMVTEAMTSLQSPTFKNSEDASSTEFSFEIEDQKNGTPEQNPNLNGYLKTGSSIPDERNSYSVSDSLNVDVPTLSRHDSEGSDVTLKDTNSITKDKESVYKDSDKSDKSNKSDKTNEECVGQTSSESTPITKFRPRSMSLSQFPSSRKNTVEKSSFSVTRASTDALPLTEGPGSRKKRKESIFEGVDINIQGPNPVHAILMQYGPLSSTQSMPSVCPNITRRHSAMPPKTVPIGLSQSDQSSSSNSVFSNTETVTSETQTEDVPRKKSFDTNRSVPRYLETDIDSVQANESIGGHDSTTHDSSNPNRNLQMHQENKTPPAISINKDANEFSGSTACGGDSPKKGPSEAKRGQERNDSYRKTATRHFSLGAHDNAPKAQSSFGAQQRSPSSEQVKRTAKQHVKSETPRHVRVEKSSPSDNVSNVQSERNADLKDGRSFRNNDISNSINNTGSRLSKSSSNLTYTSTQRRDKELRSVSYNNTSTLPSHSVHILPISKQTVSSDPVDGKKKIRRFGMPMDSKSMPSMLNRQDKTQPIRKEKRHVVSVSPVISVSNCASKHGKENSPTLRQPSYTDESSSDDDEYGMARLLQPRRRLTSTPVLSTRRASPVPRLSCVSDEGYCSHNSSNRVQGHMCQNNRRHKLSIKSDRTWISSDLEDSGVCSGELSPFSPISPSSPRFNFSDLPRQGHRGSESCSSSVIHSPTRSSPEWDSCSHKSSVSVLSLSTDVQESSL